MLAAAAFAFVSSGAAVDETAASVLVAVVFGVTTVLQLRQSQRRQHTVELITGFQNSEVLAAADTWMTTQIGSRRQVAIDIPPADERHVIAILDYYEFLSSLAIRGLVDVSLLLSLRGGTMLRCYAVCRTYVEHRRRTVGGELYQSFGLFVEEYGRRARKIGRPADPSPSVESEAAGSDVEVDRGARVA